MQCKNISICFTTLSVHSNIQHCLVNNVNKALVLICLNKPLIAYVFLANCVAFILEGTLLCTVFNYFPCKTSTGIFCLDLSKHCKCCKVCCYHSCKP